MRLSAQALSYIAAKIYSCRVGESRAGRPVEPNSYASTSSARRGFINVLKVGVAGTYCKEGLDRNLSLDRNPYLFFSTNLSRAILIIPSTTSRAPNRVSPRVLPRRSSNWLQLERGPFVVMIKKPHLTVGAYNTSPSGF
jgi:hypothetical protein